MKSVPFSHFISLFRDQMLRKRKDSPLPNQSFVSRTDLEGGRDLLVEYDRECLILKRSLDAEILKTVQEGKCLIIEGIHLDPGLYLSEFLQLNRIQESRNCPNIVYIPVVVTSNNEDHRILVMGASNSIGCRFFEAQSIPSSKPHLISHFYLCFRRRRNLW